MSDIDASRWNARYLNKAPSFQTDQLLLRHQALLQPGQYALDVACGLGHNSLWLAEQQLNTTALDVSQTGLDILTAAAQARNLSIETVCADLDQWHWPEQAFDVVLVFRYLNRAIFADLKGSIRPGGLVFYQTFGQNKLKHSPDFNPDYVLRDGELQQQFNGYEVIEHNLEDAPFASIVARRPLI